MQYNFTVRKKDKGYQIIVGYKIGRTWKQKSKQGFNTQREAKAYGEQILDEIKKNVISPLDDTMQDITFIDFYSVYMDEKHELSINSRKTYDNIIYKDCTKLHNMMIKDINHKDIINVLVNSNKSAASKNLCIVLLKAIFKHAISPYRLIRDNPCASIKKYKKASNNDVNTISNEDMDKLLTNIKDKYPIYYLVCCIARYTGARYGEIVGLCWEDIDFNNKTISISKQWSRKTDHEHGFKTPKSVNSIRTIPIPQILIDELNSVNRNKTGRIFDFKNSSTSRVNYIISRYLQDKTIHMFRHTYATSLLANGVDMQTVASLLGDGLNTVINTYIHYSQEMRNNAAKSVENIFSR